MSVLADGEARTDIINRLKRAEGQMRGIQRMVDEGAPCIDIAIQLAAVGRAVDSACHRLAVGFVQQEIVAAAEAAAGQPVSKQRLGSLIDDLQSMLAKLR
jgi:DNA-binding FrmR family transcriptional regulator